MADETNIVTLFDEDGKEIPFEHLDTFELNSRVYIVLLEVLGNGQENDEVVIFRLEEDKNSEDALIVIEDENELQEAFDEFMFRNSEDDE